MTTEVFTLTGNQSITQVHELKQLVQLLRENGSVVVAYNTSVKVEREADLQEAVETTVQTLINRVKLFELDAIPADMRYLQTRVMASGPFTQRLVDVHVTLESNVIHFTEAPWHPDNCKGGKEHHRLVGAVKRGKPFTAVYVFDSPDRVVLGPSDIAESFSAVVAGLGVRQFDVVRQDWPPMFRGGRHRIDIRIEPKSQAAVVSPASGAPPLCDVCGHITVRNGQVFKCLNCGATVEPK
ncbi:MAG: hypothetical protein HY420_01135 [Candidatus Kerfeldbacteria bacterium]|nr:hypothetical protein [Candidatus Kerfeldbacteria bacterium]